LLRRTELVRIFGMATFRAARTILPHQVDAQAVHQAATDLLAHKGNPAQQHRVIRGLPPHTSASLCRWMSDPSFWSVVAQVTKH
jgi:hypothetical protein